MYHIKSAFQIPIGGDSALFMLLLINNYLLLLNQSTKEHFNTLDNPSTKFLKKFKILKIFKSLNILLIIQLIYKNDFL